jgi:hypothetical protein
MKKRLDNFHDSIYDVRVYHDKCKTIYKQYRDGRLTYIGVTKVDSHVNNFINTTPYSELENMINEDMLMSGYDFTDPEDIKEYWKGKLE